MLSESALKPEGYLSEPEPLPLPPPPIRGQAPWEPTSCLRQKGWATQAEVLFQLFTLYKLLWGPVLGRGTKGSAPAWGCRIHQPEAFVLHTVLLQGWIGPKITSCLWLCPCCVALEYAELMSALRLPNPPGVPL